MKAVSQYKTQILLFGILIFALALRLIFFIGLQGLDDTGYINWATYILNHTYEIGPSLFQLRVGIIFPLALLYKIFGINEISTSLYPLFFSLGTIVVIFLLGKELFDEKTGLLAAFLLSFFPIDLIYSTIVLPDIPVSFLIGISVLLFLKGDKLVNRRYQYLVFLISGILIGLGYLIKLNAVLIFLFYIFYVLFKRRFKKGYLLVPLGAAIVFLIESFIYYQNTGIFAYQVFATSKGCIASDVGMKELESFWLYPYYMFVNIREFGFFYYFILSATIYLMFKRSKNIFIPISWMILLFLYLQFGTFSINGYKAPVHNPRYLSFISIPAILVLSVFFRQTQYLLKKGFVPICIAFLFISSILLISFDSYFLKEYSYYPRQAVRFLKTQPSKMIYTDFQTIGDIRYLFGSNQNNRINTYINHKFLDPKTITCVNLTELKDVYIVINWRVIKNYQNRLQIRFPEVISHPPAHWQLIKRIENPLNASLTFTLIQEILQYGIIPECISKRMLNSIEDSKKGNNMEIYYIPSTNSFGRR